MRRKDTKSQQPTKLTSSEITLPNILDGVEDQLLIIDSDYRIRFINETARKSLLRETKSPVGKTCYEVLQDRNSPCNAPLWHCPIKEVLQSGRRITVIHPLRIDVADKYLKLTMYPLRDNDGNPTAMVELRRDVSAERELESQILRRHHQFQVLHHISSAVSELWNLDSVLRIALDNVLELINGTIGGILLLDKETETLYYRIQRGLSAKYAQEMRMRLGEGIAGNVAQTGKPMLLEDISQDPRAARPDLVTTEGLKGFISIPLKTKGEVIGVMNVASYAVGHFGTDDLSLLSSIGDYLGTAIEQAKLYEELARAGERYQALLRHALTAQEEERKRIARELHDETSQAITSLTLNLQAIIGMAEAKGFGDADFMKKLKSTHAYTVRAGNEVVRLMKELRPTLLDELGMPAAIYRYAKDNLQTQGIKVSAEFRGTDERFQPETEVTLFRIAQGAIGNILEHSTAKNVAIKLDCNTNQCLLSIKDDGTGFEVGKVNRVDSSGRGAGLFTMKERANLVGGTCQVKSQPGEGTEITVTIPAVKDTTDEANKSTDS